MWHVSQVVCEGLPVITYLTELVIYVGVLLSPFQTKFVPLISIIPLLFYYKISLETHVLVKTVARRGLAKVL